MPPPLPILANDRRPAPCQLMRWAVAMFSLPLLMIFTALRADFDYLSGLELGFDYEG